MWTTTDNNRALSKHPCGLPYPKEGYLTGTDPSTEIHIANTKEPQHILQDTLIITTIVCFYQPFGKKTLPEAQECMER